MNLRNIELPPMPDLPAYSSEVFDREVKVVSETMAEQLMHDYARDAIEADRSKRMAALEARHEEAMFKYDKTKESYHEGYADALDVAIQIISGELWK